MLNGKKVWIAGHHGMLGSALARRLSETSCDLITVARSQLDLTRQNDVEQWMLEEKPDSIFLAAAKVGGIHANSAFPAEFIYDNLAIQMNVIESARKAGVNKLVFFGSSCTYPKYAPQPINEEQLLEGPPESTNVWYAAAKIAGLKMIQAYRKQYGCNFISLMPANAYGLADNFDIKGGHVIPAMIRKFHFAKVNNKKKVQLWGTGTPSREFIFVDDLADAAIFFSRHYNDERILNVGTGEEITISVLAKKVAQVVGYEGGVVFDANKPDGMPRKLLDSSRAHALGWKAKTPLSKGLEKTYEWFLNSIGEADSTLKRKILPE